jgi:hypothetical protein
MNEGYVIGGGCEHYCSNYCLHKHVTHEEFLELYDDGEGDSYYTEWEDQNDWDDDDGEEEALRVAITRDYQMVRDAAPDLLAALTDAYQYMVDYKKCQNQGLLDDMQAAINKAKGQTND